MGRLRSARVICVFAVIAAAALLAMAEIGRIIGEVAVGGETYSVSALYGLPTSVGAAHNAMAAWATASCGSIPVRGWLADHLVLDLPFIVGYTGVLLGLSRRWNLRIEIVVGALALVDLVEDALAALAIRALPDGSGCRPGVLYPSHHLLFGALYAATSIKFVLIALVAVWSGFRIWRGRGAPAGQPPILLRALKVQRFPIGVAVFLGALLLLPNGQVFDQSAEIERGWVLGHRWVGAWYLVAALLAMVALAVGLRYLGAVHVDGVRDLYGEATPTGPGGSGWGSGSPRGSIGDSIGDSGGDSGVPDVPGVSGASVDPQAQPSVAGLVQWLKAFPAKGWAALNEPPVRRGDRRMTGVWWAWLVGAGAFVALALVLSATGAATVAPIAVVCVAGVLVAVPVLTFLTGAAGLRDNAGDVRPGVEALAWRIGRLTAWTVPVIFLLSLTRAYAAPLLLGQATVAAGVVAVLAVVASAGLLVWVLSHNNVYRPASAGVRTRRRQAATRPLWRRLLGPALATAVVGVAMIGWPTHVSDGVGMMAVVALGLGVVTTFYTVLAVLGQSIAPPRFFRVIALRSTPLITLVTVMGLLATTLSSTARLHHLREPTVADNAAALSRFTGTTLPSAMSTWLSDSATTQRCAIAVPGASVNGHPVQVRPLLLVASEGGGVRAAWWTVDVLSHLQGCARSSIFLASGVSGGAVGVAVMDTAPDPRKAMRTMAGQGTLAAATDGLVVRDTVAGVFGLNVRAADGPVDDRYPDRAALIEQGWEKADPGLAQPFPQLRTGRGVGVDQMPWYTVFNSTSALTGCRVTTSDVDLYSAPDPAKPLADQPEPATCAIRDPSAAPRNVVSGSYNLFAAFPCLAGMRVSTASLNSGRFPYLTPSGAARRCETGPHAGANGALGDQLIDGGYSENTGVATLNDALLATMPQLRAHNEAAVAATAPGPVTVVLPMVVFLHNTVTSTALPTGVPVKGTPEPIVPPTAELDSGVVGSRDTLLQTTDLITADWLPTGATGSNAVVAAVNGFLPTRTITVAPHARPQVAPPLGWSMSRASQRSLDEAYNAYLTCGGGADCRDTTEYVRLLSAWKIPLKFPSS